MNAEAWIHGTDRYTSEGKWWRVWEKINQRIYKHICMTHGRPRVGPGWWRGAKMGEVGRRDLKYCQQKIIKILFEEVLCFLNFPLGL